MARLKELRRWLFAASAVVVAAIGVMYFSLFTIFGPFPKDLAGPTSAFLAGSLTVLAGSLLAPRRQVAVAVVLCVLAAAILGPYFGLRTTVTAVGGLSAVAFVAWWVSQRRTPRSTARVGRALAVLLLLFVGFVYARHVDRPASPDRPPPSVTDLLGANATRITFYDYELGGFIDHEWLWRIDAEAEVITRLVGGLGLRVTATVPSRFWRMPPYYWPRSMPPGAASFQSPSFSAETRGPDGPHYFLLHDTGQKRAFVWIKDNF